MLIVLLGVHVIGIIRSREKNVAYDAFFGELKGELKMYSGCAFVRDWEFDVLDIYKTAFIKNRVAH